MDLSKIPDFHPRVIRVDLLSGTANRGAGVAYQCHLNGGKHTCVEQDVEIVPMEKIVTVLPSDTFGISKTLPDYVVETTFHRIDQQTTRVEISHHYSTNGWKARLLNWVAKGRIARDTQAMLDAVKGCVERSAIRPGGKA